MDTLVCITGIPFRRVSTWFFAGTFTLAALAACQTQQRSSAPIPAPASDSSTQGVTGGTMDADRSEKVRSPSPVSAMRKTLPTRPAPLKATTPQPMAKAATAKKPAAVPITAVQTAVLLHPERADETENPPWKSALALCSQPTDALKIKCLLRAKYKSDPKALKLALKLYDTAGVVAGLRPKMVRSGGWRGTLHMVPELPVGRKRRKHLKWVTQAFVNYKKFFTWLQKGAPKKRNYRYTHISFKFYQTLGKRTPSASAWEWNVAYNLNGSLLHHDAGVRETIYHELFHLNDGAHRNWSARKLQHLYDSILKRCKKYMRKGNRQGAKYQACLRPYAPHRTRVARDNVFYAFHRESDVGEYAAELAVRYYLEHRAVMLKLSSKLRKRALGYSAPGKFKCGPKENATSWKLIADEFFGGADHTGPCP